MDEMILRLIHFLIKELNLNYECDEDNCLSNIVLDTSPSMCVCVCVCALTELTHHHHHHHIPFLSPHKTHRKQEQVPTTARRKSSIILCMGEGGEKHMHAQRSDPVAELLFIST